MKTTWCVIENDKVIASFETFGQANGYVRKRWGHQIASDGKIQWKHFATIQKVEI